MTCLEKLKAFFYFLAPIGVWLGIGLALEAFFEQCNDGGSPFWSTVAGFPFLHHGYYAFLILIVSLLIVSWKNENAKLLPR